MSRRLVVRSVTVVALVGLSIPASAAAKPDVTLSAHLKTPIVAGGKVKVVQKATNRSDHAVRVKVQAKLSATAVQRAGTSHTKTVKVKAKSSKSWTTKLLSSAAAGTDYGAKACLTGSSREDLADDGISFKGCAKAKAVEAESGLRLPDVIAIRAFLGDFTPAPVDVQLAAGVRGPVQVSIVGSAEDQLSVDLKSCGAAATGSCEFDLIFTPTAVGESTATMTVTAPSGATDSALIQTTGQAP